MRFSQRSPAQITRTQPTKAPSKSLEPENRSWMITDSAAQDFSSGPSFSLTSLSLAAPQRAPPPTRRPRISAAGFGEAASTRTPSMTSSASGTSTFGRCTAPRMPSKTWLGSIRITASAGPHTSPANANHAASSATSSSQATIFTNPRCLQMPRYPVLGISTSIPRTQNSTKVIKAKSLFPPSLTARNTPIKALIGLLTARYPAETSPIFSWLTGTSASPAKRSALSGSCGQRA